MADGDETEAEEPVRPKPLVRRSKGKQNERPLKLSDAQRTDIHIGILLGAGMKKNEEIGSKVGYSGKGVYNRRNGINALIISEIENIVQHVLRANQRKVKDIMAEDLQKELGVRSGKLIAAVDDAMDDKYADKSVKARIALQVMNKVLPRQAGGRGSQDQAPSSVYKVNIGELKVVHQYTSGQPITAPDKAKAIDAVSVPLPNHAPEGSGVPR